MRGPAISDLPVFATMAEAHHRWMMVLAQSPKIRAEKLYQGKNWSNYMAGAAMLKTVAEVDIYVASAGLGLISISDDIPAYDCSFSAGSHLKPTKRVLGGGRKDEWWELFNPPKLEGFTIAALPIAYTQMTRTTLLSLTDGVLITGWGGDIPSSIMRHPIKKITSSAPPGTPGIHRHSETFLSWVRQLGIPDNTKLSLF